MGGDTGRDRFRILMPFLTGDDRGRSYARIADELDMTEGAVKAAVHRMRKRYGQLLKEEVAHTVAGPEDVDEEIRYLFSVAVS
jgi:RNA polymerase sigma-70 factor (ECF subfamily)